MSPDSRISMQQRKFVQVRIWLALGDNRSERGGNREAVSSADGRPRL